MYMTHRQISSDADEVYGMSLPQTMTKISAIF